MLRNRSRKLESAYIGGPQLIIRLRSAYMLVGYFALHILFSIQLRNPEHDLYMCHLPRHEILFSCCGFLDFQIAASNTLDNEALACLST